MTIIEQFFSKIFDRLFPKLQEGDIVHYRGRKQRVIKSWHELSFGDNYDIRQIQVVLLSCHGQLLVTMDNRLLIRKLGHEPVPTFEIGDRVKLKELDPYEWYGTGFGFGTLLTSEQILSLSRQIGTVVEIDLYRLLSDSCKEPTIRVRFNKEGYEIMFHPCFLDKVPDYDII